MRGGRSAGRPTRVVLLFVAVLLVAALVASKTFQRQGQKIDQDQAIAIAEKAAGVDVDREVVRFLRSGVQQQSQWAVSLSQTQPDGTAELQATVLIDATTGQVLKLTREA